MEARDFDPGHPSQWCPGCGNYGIVSAIREALAELNIQPKDVVMVSGIGCSGKTPHYLKTYGFEGIHGRAVPIAMGIKLVNPNLKVIINTGDGDNYGIGMGHWVHGMRRNLDVLHIAHNNHIYALTKGQTAPTTREGVKTPSTPHGNPEPPVNPIAYAISIGATFVARGYAGDLKHLTYLIKEGLQHKGYSFIDVLQPCVSMNPEFSYAYYNQRIYKLEDENWDYTNKEKAIEKAWEDYYDDSRIPIGIFYKERKKTYEEHLPQLKDGPVVFDDISNVNIEDILDEFM